MRGPPVGAEQLLERGAAPPPLPLAPRCRGWLLTPKVSSPAPFSLLWGLHTTDSSGQIPLPPFLYFLKKLLSVGLERKVARPPSWPPCPETVCRSPLYSPPPRVLFFSFFPFFFSILLKNIFLGGAVVQHGTAAGGRRAVRAAQGTARVAGRMAKHHPDLIMCRKTSGVGR